MSSRLLHKVQPLVLTVDEAYLIMAAPPDLEDGVAPLSPPVPTHLPLLGCGGAPLSHQWCDHSRRDRHLGM